MNFSSLLFLAAFCCFCCLLPVSPVSAIVADVIAIAPDRSTAYPNGVHNGLLLTAKRLNLTLEIINVGNFDPATSAKVLTNLIHSEELPKIYCIWPIDTPSRHLMQQLYDSHKVPIIQINQLPPAGEDGAWEWNHLLGYAGPDDKLRASNAGKMIWQAMDERNISQPNIVALGYPGTYGGYHLSIAAFQAAIADHPSINLVKKLPLDWGTQPVYEAVLQLLTEMNGELHGIYAMDDSILMGAYQAIQDYPNVRTNITLVGTVCNGARQLLETRAQYGTTVQGPYLEGALAIEAAAEYLETGALQDPKIRFTPDPIVTSDTWDKLFINFEGLSYTADDLCTWSLFYERVAGVVSVDTIDDICLIIDCRYIPRILLYLGYVMCGTNYLVALVSGMLLYIYRNKQIIQLGQPFFLALIILGSMVDNTSILFMGRDNRNGASVESLDRACFVFPWLLSIGHMMTTATLVAKIYRVKKLVGACSTTQGLRKVRVTITEVAIFILLFISVDAILLIAWSVTDPFQWEIKVTTFDKQGYISEARGQCDTQHGSTLFFPMVIALFHLATLIYANILAYQTSGYHQISDSKSVAIALFNSIQLLVIVTPLLIVVDGNVAISYFIRTCFVFLNNLGVLMLVVVPKLYLCVLGQGHKVPDLHEIVRASTASGQRTARSSVRISGIDAFQSSEFQRHSILSDCAYGTGPRTVSSSPSASPTEQKDGELRTTSGSEHFSDLDHTDKGDKEEDRTRPNLCKAASSTSMEASHPNYLRTQTSQTSNSFDVSQHTAESKSPKSSMNSSNSMASNDEDSLFGDIGEDIEVEEHGQKIVVESADMEKYSDTVDYGKPDHRKRLEIYDSTLRNSSNRSNMVSGALHSHTSSLTGDDGEGESSSAMSEGNFLKNLALQLKEASSHCNRMKEEESAFVRPPEDAPQIELGCGFIHMIPADDDHLRFC